MAIIIDIKNAIRKVIYSQDNTINFFFNEILKVQYPYVFFYIPSFKLEKSLDPEHWRKLSLMCVVEYAKNESNSASDLWEYADSLSEALSLFSFSDTRLTARNMEFKIVDGVLQVTFDLEFYVKAVEEADLMQELNLQLK